MHRHISLMAASKKSHNHLAQQLMAFRQLGPQEAFDRGIARGRV
jgi:hypothetical protein